MDSIVKKIYFLIIISLILILTLSFAACTHENPFNIIYEIGEHETDGDGSLIYELGEEFSVTVNIYGYDAEISFFGDSPLYCYVDKYSCEDGDGNTVEIQYDMALPPEVLNNKAIIKKGENLYFNLNSEQCVVFNKAGIYEVKAFVSFYYDKGYITTNTTYKIKVL